MDTVRGMLLALALSGCATVAPYEREALTTTRMSLDGDAGETSLERSRLRTREEGHLGAAPGGGGGGGGCGCN
jgi:hypothetical protein